ncbi:uncharacterized protein LTR77_007866 [Saxophila tyrrhenica]|uniref:Uncharacterized protein n=1 Tax=Saxophila tyrrhenica TaxID=1690608 RepID=A0AAV9P422_9PEZI|nr:hypothetical protein LTR77_007866 [Saxophila tyrrhenica]
MRTTVLATALGAATVGARPATISSEASSILKNSPNHAPLAGRGIIDDAFNFDGPNYVGPYEDDMMSPYNPSTDQDLPSPAELLDEEESLRECTLRMGSGEHCRQPPHFFDNNYGPEWDKQFRHIDFGIGHGTGHKRDVSSEDGEKPAADVVSPIPTSLLVTNLPAWMWSSMIHQSKTTLATQTKTGQATATTHPKFAEGTVTQDGEEPTAAKHPKEVEKPTATEGGDKPTGPTPPMPTTSLGCLPFLGMCLNDLPPGVVPVKRDLAGPGPVKPGSPGHMGGNMLAKLSQVFAPLAKAIAWLDSMRTGVVDDAEIVKATAAQDWATIEQLVETRWNATKEEIDKRWAAVKEDMNAVVARDLANAITAQPDNGRHRKRADGWLKRLMEGDVGFYFSTLHPVDMDKPWRRGVEGEQPEEGHLEGEGYHHPVNMDKRGEKDDKKNAPASDDEKPTVPSTFEDIPPFPLLIAYWIHQNPERAQAILEHALRSDPQTNTTLLTAMLKDMSAVFQHSTHLAARGLVPDGKTGFTVINSTEHYRRADVTPPTEQDVLRALKSVTPSTLTDPTELQQIITAALNFAKLALAGAGEQAGPKTPTTTYEVTMPGAGTATIIPMPAPEPGTPFEPEIINIGKRGAPDDDGDDYPTIEQATPITTEDSTTYNLYPTEEGQAEDGRNHHHLDVPGQGGMEFKVNYIPPRSKRGEDGGEEESTERVDGVPEKAVVEPGTPIELGNGCTYEWGVVVCEFAF